MTPAESPFPGLVRCLRIPALAALGCLGSLFGQSALVGNSPFASVGIPGSKGSAPAEAYELAGSTVQGSDVSVCIYQSQTKRSQWIPVGGDSDGIRVISYDASRDTAVVLIAGARKELTMRKAAIASQGASLVARVSQPEAAPAAAAFPIGAALPSTPASVASEQREARMLVSDLLEIGVQQRKAYQEARQKAASGTPPPPDN